MIHTESTAYVEVQGRLCPLTTTPGTPRKWFVSAPTLDDVRELLKSEATVYCDLDYFPLPVLFITRITRNTALI